MLQVFITVCFKNLIAFVRVAKEILDLREVTLGLGRAA